jgi:hypothetical protein
MKISKIIVLPQLLIVMGVFALLSIGCSKQREKNDLSADSDTINFFSLKRIEKNIPGDLSTDRKYIKLDHSDQFLFSRIDKVKVTENKIYVLDGKLKRLLVFDNQGKGVICLDKLGQGPEEYLQITDFDVSPSGDIFILDGRLDKLFVYNEHAESISAGKLPFEADIIHILSDNKLLFGLSSWNKGEGASKKIAITDMDLKIEKTDMDYDEFIDEAYWISSYNFMPVGNHIFYNKQIDNVVHVLSSSDGEPVKAYVFDFGRKNVPDKNKKDIEGTLKDFESYCCLKNFAIITDKYALGTVWDELKTKAFIIDRKNQVLYLSKETVDNDKSKIAGMYGDYIVSFIDPGKYEDADNDMPIDIKEYVENGNFVVCLYKLP